VRPFDCARSVLRRCFTVDELGSVGSSSSDEKTEFGAEEITKKSSKSRTKKAGKANSDGIHQIVSISSKNFKH
jgi:hypothetical protein